MLQTIRRLLIRPGCFRLERELPGGIRTHVINAPCQGAPNNAAERALRCIAVGRKNWTFCGSDRGGQRAAAMYTLIATAKLNNIDPEAWLADVLRRISDHPASRLHELLPWNWSKPETPEQAKAA